MKNEKEYRIRQAEAKMELLRNPPADNDVFNLKFMLLSINPYSPFWRYGMMRSLRRAIKALERENERGGDNA